MTATRAYPDDTTDPGGLGGATYAGRVKAEGDAQWNRVWNFVGTVAGTNTITGVCSPVLTGAPVNGQVFALLPANANTGAVTVNLDSTGAIALVDINGTALASGALATNEPIIFHYDGALSKFRLNHMTKVQINALIAANGAPAWVPIGTDLSMSGNQESVIGFSVDTYSAIRAIGSGISLTGTNNLLVQLQTSGGSNLFSQTITVGTATKVTSYTVEYLTGDPFGGATMVFTAELKGAVNGTLFTTQYVGAANNVKPGRCRVASSSTDHFDAGIHSVYGLKK